MNFLKKINFPKGVIVISLVYWLIFVLMQPLFGKAFLDDFAYILTTKHLVLDNYLKVSEWTAVSLLAQVFWGSLFAFFLGFSMESLIISTVAIFYLGIVSFYFILKELDLSEFKSVMFTFVLLAFPWNLLFAYSFMTDIPFMSLLVISLLFYIKGIKRNNLKYMFLGSVFISIDYLIRQTAIMIPFSLVILFLMKGSGEGKLLKYGKQIIVSISLPILIFIGYFKWLGIGDNKTLGQILAFDRGLVHALNNYFWPRDILKIGTVSRYYSETINRAGVYLIQLIGLLWPFLLVFSIKLNTIKRLINVKNVVFYLFILLTIMFVLFVPPYSKIILSPVSNFYFPQELIYFPSYLGPFDMRSFRDIWDKSVIYSIPLFAVFIAALVYKSWQKFLHWKKRFPAILYALTLFISLGVIWLSFYRQVVSLSARYPKAEIMSETWLFFAIISVLSFMILTLVYGVRVKRLDTKNTLYLFVILSLLITFSWTLILPYIWFEYVIAFMPFVVILFALATKQIEISKFRLVVITLIVLFVSFANAKSAHTVLGSVWKGAEKLVEEGVDPRNIETFEFAWYPWWYYEETFKAKLDSVSGDKNKILRLKTWESVPQNELTHTVQFVKNATSCATKSKEQVKIDTLFLHGVVCASNEKY